MLTKRTQILFEEHIWKQLSMLAAQKKVSIGNLVREAVEEKYVSPIDLEQRRKVVDSIMKMKEEYQRKYPKKIKKKESIVSMVRRMREERTQHIENLMKKRYESNT